LPRAGKRVLKPAGDPKADKARYYMLTHGCHLVDLARYLGGPIKAVHARLLSRFGAYCWFVETEFENGALGHLDLTVAVRMDWHEGFQIYGEHGSAIGKIFNPWYYKSSEVDLFHEKDSTTSRVLGADGHFYRRQLEGFADTVLKRAPMQGASIDDGVASVRAMAAISESVRSGRRVLLSDAVEEI
jgi:predicted dehydrogenase